MIVCVDTCTKPGIEYFSLLVVIVMVVKFDLLQFIISHSKLKTYSLPVDNFNQVKVLQLWLGRGGDDHLVCGRFWETCKIFSSTGDIKLEGHEE